MGMFDNLNTGVTVEVEEEKLGGGGNYITETKVYDFVVEMAYGGQSAGGAYFIDAKLVTEDGKILKVREYITSGTEKGCLPYYVDKNSGKQKALPGYAKMNALDVLLTGNPAQYPVTENKTIPLWNKDAEKEVPTEAQVVTSWIGKPISAMVQMVREFKRAQNQTTKKWENTSETRDFAEVVHFVDAVTGQTRSEKMTGKAAELKGKFEAKNTPESIYDKTKGKGSKPGAAPAAAAPVADSPFANK